MCEIINFFLKESESESESEEEEEEEEPPTSVELREEESPQIETEVVERPTITVRKNRGYCGIDKTKQHCQGVYFKYSMEK
jgi:hypothetical protein